MPSLQQKNLLLATNQLTPIPIQKLWLDPTICPNFTTLSIPITKLNITNINLVKVHFTTLLPPSPATFMHRESIRIGVGFAGLL